MLRAVFILLICGGTLWAGDARAPEAKPWPAADLDSTERVRADVSARVTSRFELLISGPWILATDLDSRTARTVLNDVVNTAAVRVREQLFPQVKIQRPVVIYLLKDTSSYMSWSHRLFQETPPTAMGYYDRRESYILTHADNGFGPMLHEMVHVMAEADYPGIPPWLNEGLGSLFEDYTQQAGSIEGVNNWRLSRFNQEVLQKKPVALSTLFTLNQRTLYAENTLSYYSALRQLMLWLQEQDRVLAYYTALRDSKSADPGQTLVKVTGKKSLEEVEAALRQWSLVQTFQSNRSGPKIKSDSSSRFR